MAYCTCSAPPSLSLAPSGGAESGQSMQRCMVRHIITCGWQAVAAATLHALSPSAPSAARLSPCGTRQDGAHYDLSVTGARALTACF